MGLSVRLSLLAIVATIAFAAERQDGAQEPPRPRVLLVDLDDVGTELVARSHTPTLDGLRAAGRYYPHLVTSPTCSPSRAMIHTGAHCSHPGVLLGRVIRRKDTGARAYALPAEPLVPLAGLVAASGRSTAKVGKWHLSHVEDLRHPKELGWQSYRGAMSNLIVTTDTYTSYPKVIDGILVRVDGRYITSDETDDAIDAVRRGVDLVSVSYHAAHKPWHRPPAALLREDARGGDADDELTELELSALMLEACDRELGRLLAAAREQGYTVFVFPDNGSQNSRETRGGKGTFLDSGIVVPLWVTGPEVEPGEDRSILSLVDLYATVADLLGIERDVKTEGPDSISFAETLRGGAGTRRYAIAETFDVLGEDPRSRTSIQWQRAVRGERFKLFENRGGGLEVFIDLEADPKEEKNLLLGGRLDPEAVEAYEFLRLVLDTM